MLLRRAPFLLAFSLLAVATAFAQPDGYHKGTYKIAMTIAGTRYKLPVGGYRITPAVIQGDTVPILNVWIATADAQAAALPAGSALKGKTATKSRFFKQIPNGRYQRISLTEILISGVTGSGTGGTILQLNLGGQELEFGGQDLELGGQDLELGGQDLGIKAPRDIATGQASGIKGTLIFSGAPVELGGGDWE
jgi:hypothetical protein